MTLPTFLGIGVEKSGTTSIYHYLKQHPEIFMSPIKETNFLEQEWGEDVVQAHRDLAKRVDTLEKYQHLFETAGNAKAIGEISPNYLFHYQSSSKRIQRYVPHAKMIAILRDPVERAFSDYLMHLRDVINGGHPTPLADQVRYKSQTSFTIRKGLYYAPLKFFINTFGAGQIKVCLYEDLCCAPVELMQDIYRFLGVNDLFVPNVSQKAQVAQVPKSTAVNRLLRTKNPLRSGAASALKLLVPPSARQRIRAQLIHMNSQTKESVTLSVEERSLLADFYRDDVQKLQELIQRDLSGWLKVS
ncbi:MAG: sulfotransferase [Leptolyngbyaceae bacterium]|nr:sulfotransferase [Leptolyngbyaceae bacterium]